MSTNVVFKVGDKVVRKEANKDGWWEKKKPQGEVFTVSSLSDTGFSMRVGNEFSWMSDYFDLYVEPAAMPKFKVGDRVVGTNINGYSLGEGEITEVYFRYKTTAPAMRNVSEEHIAIAPPPPPKPREVILDGVTYREVLVEEETTFETEEWL